ncbi:hypothetical protein K4H28_01480 [Deefgea tanakiae]|uniref:Uncharacterized protein n=1 Tax=Deefgea tanakiae TaxID=2865840 RepID=A0ABX8Z9W4_9NEIS|nr:hypothetical protein [Deefgea tanakiae]QZA78134.1 hypothetical protein K4H28_01480 [Deefgea tanakiae]
MVGGIFVPQLKSNKNAQILFIDPEPDADLIKILSFPEEVVASAVRRQSLAKSLAMSGLSITATGLNNERTNEKDLNLIRNIEKGELTLNQFKESEAGWKKSIQIQAVNDEFEKSRIYTTELTIEIPRELTKALQESFNQAGNLEVEFLNNWLQSRILANRSYKEQIVQNETIEKPSEKDYEERSNQEKKPTIFKNPDDFKLIKTNEEEKKSSSLVTPAGISFSITINEV